MSLADKDRPRIQWHYEPWGEELTLQALSAAEFATIKDSITDEDPDSKLTDMKLAAALCATAVKQPVYSQEEWLREAKPLTLTDISQKVLDISLLNGDEAKKN